MPSEESSLLPVSGGSSSPFSSDDGNMIDSPQWPSTFERSISLLASPMIAAADVEEFTKSPGLGESSLLVARRRQQEHHYYQQTPEQRGLDRVRLTSSERELNGNDNLQRVQSLDFQTNRKDILQIQERRRKDAEKYRKQLLKQQKLTATKKSQPDGKTSFAQCVFNLANILLGVGLLGLPYCFKSAGYYGGMLCIVVFGVIAWRTAILIGRELNGDPRPSERFIDSPYKSPLQPGSSNAARMLPPVTSFPDIARRSFGDAGSFVLSVILYFELFSVVSILFVSIGDHLHQIFNTVSNSTHMTIVAIVSMVPTILLRTPVLLSYLSMVGTVSTMCIVLTVILSAVTWDTNKAPPVYTQFEPNGLPMAFGLVAYCFSGHAIVPSIYTSMEKPQEFEKMITFTFIIVVACCLLIAFSGYYMFGDDVADQVTLSLESQSEAAKAMKALTWLIILTGFEEIFTPYLETEGMVHVVSGFIKLILTAGALVVAIFVPSFSYLCTLVGMICTITISIVFPAAAHLQLFQSRLSLTEKTIDWIFVVFGLIVAVIGTAVSL